MAGAPQTTLVPFESLPSCAKLCGALYDVNGGCVPPAVATAGLDTYASCFCKNPKVSPLSTGTVGVCDSVCTAGGGQADLASIHTWFSSFCSANANGKDAAQTTTTSTSKSSGGSSSSHSGSSHGNGSWLSTHWQWVIFIVVVVVGIAAIWIGACIWRRRYLRKKDRQYALSKSLAARTSTGAGSGLGNQSQRSVHLPQAGLFAPANLSSANVFATEKPRQTGSSRRN